MNINISLSSEKFDELIRCLSVLKDICTDIDIKEGIIRQRSNDHGTIFEIDLQKILNNNEVNIPISGLKQKLDLLKCFSGHDIELEVQDNKIVVSDSNSSLEIKVSHLDLMDNKWITREEVDKIFSINEENKILDTKISRVMSERMKSISQIFNSDTVQMSFSGDTASISGRTASKDQSAKFIDNIMLDDPIENMTTSLVLVPFIIDHDNDIDFKMYNVKENECSNEFRTSISDDIDINVYTRCRLMSRK